MKECNMMIEVRMPMDVEVDYWYRNEQEMTENEVEHVREMIEEGYVEGELFDGNENRGWWKLKRE